MILGVTMGDSSGVGPEILLNAWRSGEIKQPVVAYGDLAVLQHCNEVLGYGVPLRRIAHPRETGDGALHVIDHGLMTVAALAIGRVSREWDGQHGST